MQTDEDFEHVSCRTVIAVIEVETLELKEGFLSVQGLHTTGL